MPEAQAVTKTEGGHARREASASPEPSVPVTEIERSPTLAPAVRRLDASPHANPAERSRTLINQLPSNAMRQQLAVALGRQHGNAFAQRVLAPPAHPSPLPTNRRETASDQSEGESEGNGEQTSDSRAEAVAQLAAPPPPPRSPSVPDRQDLDSDAVQRSPAATAVPNSAATKPSVAPPQETPTESRPPGQTEPANAQAVQREEEGGLLDTALNWVKGAFNNLRNQASAAMAGLRQTANSGVEALQSGLQAVSGQVTGAWDGIQNGAKDLLKAAEGQGTGLLSGIVGHLGAVRSALVELDAEKLRAAWAAVTGAASQAWNTIKSLASGALARGEGLWNQFQGVANGLVAGLRSQAQSLLTTLPGVAQAIQSQVKGLWDSIVGRVSGVLQKLPGWSTIERMWSGVWSEVQSAANSALSLARSAWDGIQAKANSVWQGIQSAWAGVKKWVSDKASGLVGGFERIAKAFSTGGIAEVISTITKTSKLFQAIRQVIKNPESLLDPLVKGITSMLSPLPQQTRTEVQNRVQATGGGGAGGPPAAAGPPVMRQAAVAAPVEARTTAGLGTVLHNIYDITTDHALKIYANIGKYVLDTLKQMFWPPATGAALGDDVTKMVQDLGKHWDRLSTPRTDSWGHFYEDASRLASNLIELVQIIWRTVNTVLGRLFPYVTLGLMLAGAVEGAGAGTAVAAVIEFFSAGAATPVAGAAEGAGPLAGGLAGLKAASMLGQPLFQSFVLAEAASIVKSVADLLAVPQTIDEQKEDYEQISDSIIALATAGILVAITEVGAAIARAFKGIAEGFKGEKPIVTDNAPPGRVTTQVPGLFSAVDTATAPKGWKFTDTFHKIGPETIVNTEVVAPDGTVGHVQRGLNPSTNTFVMHEAFLDDIPKDARWVPTDPPLVPGKGTPLEAYLTMRQMKLLENQLKADGKLNPAGAFAGSRTVVMSRIVNVRTCLELAVFEKQGLPLDKAVLQTQSVQYANNSIVQSGGRIASAKIERGIRRPAGKLDVTPETLSNLKLSPTDEVLYAFDIVLEVEPAGAPGPTAPGGAPSTITVPKIAPIPGGRDDED